MMLKELALWPQKITAGLEGAQDFMTQYGTRIPKNIKKIAFVGMGGSGIAGRIIKTFLDKKTDIITQTIDTNELPANIGTDTLVCVTSYSGDTWETLDVLRELAHRFIPTIVLTHGGGAALLAETKNIPLWITPESVTPRSALGNFLGFWFGVLDKLGIIEGEKIAHIFRDHALTFIPQFEQGESYFKDFLSTVQHADFFHLWGIRDVNDAMVYRAQTQFNENSKVQSVLAVFPELNHNLINGFEQYTTNPCILFYTTEFLTAHISKAVDATSEILKERGVLLYKPPVLGNTLEGQLFNTILWSDYASYYLGKIRGVDIEAVKVITKLKEALKAKGIK